MNRVSSYLTTILLIASGCKNNSTSVNPPVEPTEFRQALIPLALGNEWIYTDSLFTADSVSVETYTLAVSSYRIDLGKVWWQLQERRPTYTTLVEIAAQNDSIFSLQHNFQWPVVSLDYIPPSATDTLWFYSLHGGDVGLEKSVWLNGQYIVPAGSFDSCAIFFSRPTPDGYTEVLKPRIGIVQKEIQHSSSFRRKGVLIDYHLKR